jgi:hypothetical protein
MIPSSALPQSKLLASSARLSEVKVPSPRASKAACADASLLVALVVPSSAS